MAPPMANPLAEDSKLKKLLNDVTGVPDEVEFKRWRDSFLSAMDKHLTKEGTSSADAMFSRFVKGAGSLARDVRRLEQLKERGELKSDPARRCLQSITDKIVVVTAAIRKLAPGNREEERRVGFTKFSMIAVLVRDGFVEYDRLEKIQIHLGRLRREGLIRVAEANTLEAIDKYGDEFDNVGEVLTEIGLYPAIEKGASFVKGDWVPQAVQRRQSTEDISELKNAMKKKSSQNSGEPTVDSTSESTMENSRQKNGARGSNQESQARPRGRDERPVRGPRAKSVGAPPRSRSDGPDRGLRRTSSDQMNFAAAKSPGGDSKMKLSMNLKRPAPGSNGRSDRSGGRGGVQRSKSLGPPIRRLMVGVDESDTKSTASGMGRTGQNKAAMFLRPNLRDNNATVRQKKDSVATTKRQAAGPTPWRQRMQEEKAAQQSQAPLVRRKSFAGFAGAVESSSDADKTKSSDGSDTRGRGRSMTPWRNRGATEESGPVRRRGVSLGRRPTPPRDSERTNDLKRTITPHRRRPGETSSLDGDNKGSSGRGRALQADGRGRSRAPSAPRRTEDSPISQKNSARPKRRQSPPPPNPKATAKSSKDSEKRPTPSKVSSPNKSGNVKLSRDGAKKTTGGSNNKEKKERSQNDANKDSRRKRGFFKKKGKDAKEPAEEEEEDVSAAFSVEDSTPDGAKKSSKTMTIQRPKKKPTATKNFDAPDSPSRLFKGKAEFGAPRRAKSMPLEKADSPFNDDPFAQTADPFADNDDPFAVAVDPFAENGPEFVGVDDESSGSEEESSSGSEASEDESGSFFTSSEEEEEDDSGEETDSEESSEEEESSDEESESSETDKQAKRRNPRAKAARRAAAAATAPEPEAPIKGNLPKRKTPQGRPDEDGFCPCCGQGWPGYDKWSKILD